MLASAADDGRVLVTLGTDFGALVAHSGSRLPSFVLLRGEVTRRPVSQAELLLVNLDQFEHELDGGAASSSATIGSACARSRSSADDGLLYRHTKGALALGR